MDAMILLILQMGDGGFRSDLPKVTFLRSIELKYKLQYNGNPGVSSAKEAQASEDPEIISFSGKLMKTTYEPLVVIHWRNIFFFFFPDCATRGTSLTRDQTRAPCVVSTES